MPVTRFRFDRGTLAIESRDADVSSFPSVLWDERTCGFRAPAYAAPMLVEHALAAGLEIEAKPWPTDLLLPELWRVPTLRAYQHGALDAWQACGRRGVVVIPTGGGKTRIAVAAMALARVPAAVLCPTRALMAQWQRELAAWYAGAIGAIGDGNDRLEPLTVLTFESAYRKMDSIGDRFALLVIDEVHHFSGGVRAEALEMSTAPLRLGLTATAPPLDSAASARLDSLVGQVVTEVALDELLGVHLADLDVVRLSVRLTPAEREEYLGAMRPFAELRDAFGRANPEADWASLVRALGRSAAGLAALRGFQRGVAIASFPQAKRAAVRRLLETHASDKVLVFTPSVDAAYVVGRDCLLPVLVAETSRHERDEVLARFRDGRLRAIASSRVLNEGIDVPDAAVAILVGGTLGTRELVQRVGRVLRRSEGKRALVYELTTSGTIDDRRAHARRRRLAPSCAALA